MPKYFQDKVAGYYLYYTKHCIMEAMHAHASDRKMTEGGSAKFFVREDGSSYVQERGRLTDHEISVIQRFIARHYKEMYKRWSEDSEKAYIFHYKDQGEIYIGSSSMSRSALTSGIEWNYRLRSRIDEVNYKAFYREFENLYDNHSICITDEVLKAYSASWHLPAVSKDLEKYDRMRNLSPEKDDSKIQSLFQPRGAQIEALYALRCTREEGAEKALVVAATGAYAKMQTGRKTL